jgi:8-oxo-dGTP pyrophosphatase MutT (NUDIX family)
VILSERARFVHTLNTDWVPDGFAGYRIGAGVGGWCEPGETPWQTAHREAAEETGTTVRLLDAPRTWFLERGQDAVELNVDDRPAPLAVSRFPNSVAGGDAFGVVFIGEHEGELSPGDDVAALVLLPIDVWPDAETRLHELVARGAIVIGDVTTEAAVWPHPDDHWPVVRGLLSA